MERTGDRSLHGNQTQQLIHEHTERVGRRAVYQWLTWENSVTISEALICVYVCMFVCVCVCASPFDMTLSAVQEPFSLSLSQCKYIAMTTTSRGIPYSQQRLSIGDKEQLLMKTFSSKTFTSRLVREIHNFQFTHTHTKTCTVAEFL